VELLLLQRQRLRFLCKCVQHSGVIKYSHTHLPLECCRRWYAFFHDWKESSGIIADFYFVGWLYTIVAGIMLLSGSLTMLVWWKGGEWREAAEAREIEHAKCSDIGKI
jgi:hypothetical protein